MLMVRSALDTATGRWLSEDPLGLAAGSNLYTYVENDPIKWYDPSGLVSIHPNGNWTASFDPFVEDGVCSGVAYPLTMFSQCATKCCIVHDSCYKDFHCNQTSWVSTITGGMTPCDFCNLTAVVCIATRGSATGGTCSKCK